MLLESSYCTIQPCPPMPYMIPHRLFLISENPEEKGYYVMSAASIVRQGITLTFHLAKTGFFLI